MKKTNISMKSIAATLAALTMMSPINLAVYATEMTDAAEPQVIISESTVSEDESIDTASQETPADAAEALPGEPAEEIPAEIIPAEEISAEPAAEETATKTEDDTAETGTDAVLGMADTAPVANVGETADDTASDKKTILYTITFDTDGGSEIEPITVAAGTEIEFPEDPVKDGSYFLCWDTPIPETMPEQDITVKARWSDTPVYNSIEEGFADEANVQIVRNSEADAAEDDEPLLMAAPDISFCYSPVYSSGNDFSGLEDLGKDMGVAMADAGFDMLAEAIPGGKIILAPFQVLFHKGVDGEDPMDVMNEKLDSMDNKLDEMDAKLDELSRKSDENTAWIGRKVDNTQSMGKVRDSFVSLSGSVRDLSRDIKGIETNTRYANNTEKVFMIARLGTQKNYQDVSRCVYTIQNSMDGDRNTFVSFYDTIYNNKALERLFSLEAYNDSKPIVEDLITQYVSAAALMQEVEIARKAVANFTEDDLAQLNPKIRALYDDYALFDENRQAQNNGDPVQALVACSNGYKKFMADYNNNDYINRGTVRKTIKCDFVYTSHIEESNSAARREQSLSKTERKEFVEYLRRNYPGTSVYSFCNDYLHLECTGDVDSHAFLVLDETVLEEKEIVVDDINWIGHGTKEYDVYGKLAVTVRLSDKNVETQKLDIKYCYEIKAYGLFKINHWNCRRHSKYSSCTTGFKYFENTYMLFV